MSKGILAPYKILILDNNQGIDSWGNLTKLDIEEKGFEGVHVYDVVTALELMDDDYFDLLIIDLDLGGEVDGIKFQENIRKLGYTQPIMFVSGNQEYLDLPIYRYAHAFASGPVVFFDKTTDDFDSVLDEAINRIDPILRSLKIMQINGLGNKEFTIRDKRYSVNNLLMPGEETNSIIRALKESFQSLLLENMNDLKE